MGLARRVMDVGDDYRRANPRLRRLFADTYPDEAAMSPREAAGLINEVLAERGRL